MSTFEASRDTAADCIVIGAGIFGMYAAKRLVDAGNKVIILERGLEPFSRASAINQARVHNGYHYPRSQQTAKEVGEHFHRFLKEFHFAINNNIRQVYAIASKGSKTTAIEFVEFCEAANVPLKTIDCREYFMDGVVDAAFLVDECTFDFKKIKEYLLKSIGSHGLFVYGATIQAVEVDGSDYRITADTGQSYRAPLVINATYFGVNEIIDAFNAERFAVKYELCEVAFCRAPAGLKDVGITVMDGDYFSVMPFGNESLHTLTSVEYTPQVEIHNDIQSLAASSPKKRAVCTMHSFQDCVICQHVPHSSWATMNALAQTFLKPKFNLQYEYSKYEFKTILTASESDDSRPTIIRQHSTQPTFISILSGKISTIYDIEKYL